MAKKDKTGERRVRGSSRFTKLKKALTLAGFTMIAYSVIQSEGAVMYAIQIKKDNPDNGSFLEIPELMSQLVDKGFQPVPKGISSAVPQGLTRDTILFLRTHREKDGLGNYLVYDGEDHRPLPVSSYSKILIPEEESVTVVVNYQIPEGIIKFVPRKNPPEAGVA